MNSRQHILLGAGLMLGLCAFGSGQAAQVTSYWGGSDYSDWNISGNWSNAPALGGFPNNGNAGVATYDAIINNGNATVNQDITIQKFTLGGGGSIDGDSNLVCNDTITWTAGGMMSGTGTTTAAGGTAIDGQGGSVIVATRTLQLEGLTTLTNGVLAGGYGAVVDNRPGGVFDIRDDSGIRVYYVQPGVVEPKLAGSEYGVLLNEGTLVKSGAGTNASLVSLALTNSGIVQVNVGTLSFAGGYTQTAGSLVLNGGVVSSSNALSIQGGCLCGTGTVNAAVSNSGTISPGFPTGRFDINGDVTLQTGSRLAIELGGYTQGMQHDFINITGTPTFGGNLLVTFTNNFISTVTNGAAFTVLTSSSPIAGAFANVASGGTLASTDGYARFTVTYAAVTNLQLTGLVIVDSVGDGIPNWWRAAFFGGDGSTTNDQSCAACDPDGDGLSNLQEFLAGTDPTDSQSGLRITAIAKEGNDIRVTWTTVGGKKYALQTNAPPDGASFTNNFSDLSSTIVVPGSGESTTNFLHSGGTTNVPARCYRVRLVP